LHTAISRIECASYNPEIDSAKIQFLEIPICASAISPYTPHRDSTHSHLDFGDTGHVFARRSDCGERDAARWNFRPRLVAVRRARASATADSAKAAPESAIAAKTLI